MKNKLKNIFCFEFFITILYIFITFITVILHEPWFDEAQSWMIAKDLNFFEIINQMKYEGHSAMWSLILHLFIKMGFNYNIQNIFTWFLSILAVIFVMYKVKIPNIIKVPLLFTVGPLYYCSVFARPYVLIFLIFILLLYYYDRRYESPYIVSILLLILSNSHLIVMGFIGALFFIELYGLIKYKNYKKERIMLMSFMILGILLFFFQIVGSIMSRTDIVSSKNLSDYLYALIATIREFLLSHAYLSWAMFLSFIIFLLLSVMLYKEDKLNAFIYILSILFFIALSIFVYYLNEFKFFYIILLLVFCCRNLFDNKSIKYLLFVFLLIGVISSFNSILLDWNNIYSMELNIYKDFYLKNEKPRIISFGEATVLSMYCEECSIYNINADKFISYDPYINDLTVKGITYDNILKIIKEENIDYILMKETYYINDYVSLIVENLEQNGIVELRKIYERGIISDAYYLFTVDKK